MLKENRIYIPFYMELSSLRQLLLFNFEKDRHEIYYSFELQYINYGNGQEGYRLIAYLNDGFVDIYDEKKLPVCNKESFSLCGKGCKNYTQVDFGIAYMTESDSGIHAEVKFKDIYGNTIHAKVKENRTKKSIPFNLIAPIGHSSSNPSRLPVIAMYGFDFSTKKNTEIFIKINGKNYEPDPFIVPIPKNGSMRYFTRYGLDCEHIEFCPEWNKTLEKREISDTIIFDNMKCIVKQSNNNFWLKEINVLNSNHTFKLQFDKEGFPDLLRMKLEKANGKFEICMDKCMGKIAGIYEICKSGNDVKIRLNPNEGWISKNKQITERMILSKNSIFRKWPASYIYEQNLNLETGKSVVKWKRR